MPEFLRVLQLAIEVAFALLAIRTVVSWVRQPDRRHGNLALALGSLAILILISPLLVGTGATVQLLTDVALVMFLVSGYGLLMFRDSFVPFRPRTNLLITAGIVAIGLIGIVLELPANPETQHSPLQSLVLVAVLGVWVFCILEPIVTFWIAAGGRPAVEKARLRAISIGYAGLLLVVGEAAFVLDSDASVLAAHGISVPDATALGKRSAFLKPEGNADGHAPWQAGTALVIPLDLREGRGAMILLSGRLSPMFGDDELGRLHQYAASITAGLDRVALSSKIAALERAKTDFLNIASHELRGPMTVIKGYLTMLDAGALGDMSPKAHAVLPLLISKSDEVNWMIEQMIEAARLEEGRLALKRQRTDIVELTDSAIEGVKMLLTGHELRVDAPQQAIEADVDPDRFQIVVRNLLSNAAKYSNIS